MQNEPDETLVFLVTGSRGAGKTSFCQALAQSARDEGWKVSGVISPPAFEGHTRSAIIAQALSSGEQRQLAARISPGAGNPEKGPSTLNWQFDRAVIAWANQTLLESIPTDLLIVDELGFLEFEREQGWMAAFDVIDSGQYSVGVVVVRSELLAEALVRWPDANIIEIDTPVESTRKAKALAQQLF